MADEVVEEYRSSLEDLTFNSKPLISMLTMLADDHVQYAAEIVQVIEARIQKGKPSEKLPALYLLDSIIKNMSDSSYPRLFSQNLVSMFCGVFEKVDEKTRQAMWKLRQTWAEIIPNKRLYALDIRIQLIDPAWPITSQPPEEPANIHVNPKFLIKQEEAEKAKKEQEEQEALMRQQLLAKQQELLKLQQERLELELAEAKARLPPQLPGQPAPAVPKTVIPTKVESSDRSSSGSPVTIPTIAVQGIVRDPRSGARDPRLSRGGGASHSPAKEIATSSAAAPQAKRTTVSASKVLRSTPTGSPVPHDIAATPSESASKPRASSSSRSSGLRGSPRDKDDHSKDPRSTRDKSSHGKSSGSSSSSRKKLSPLKTRQADRRETEDNRKAGSSADRYSGGRSSKHSPTSSSSNSSSRSGHRSHRQSSRSLSPEKDKKTRSRSRSPRRSPRGSSLERKDVASHPRVEPTPPSRDVDKRQRSPDADVVVVEHKEPSQPQPDETGSDLNEPPAKKSKPEEALPDDFRELFGNEDQDYRCMPTTSFPKVPTTPPTPGTPSTPSSGRWAQFKAERPQEFPFQQPRLTVDMPSPGGQLQDVDMRSPPLRRMSAQTPSIGPPPLMSISPDQMNINIPAPLMLEQLDSVLSEADAQLRSGRLSHEQHQAILKQLGELQKLQQLKLQLQARPPRDDPFQLGTERPPAGNSPRYDDTHPLEGFNREGKDVDQRTPPSQHREALPPMAPPPRPPVLDFRPDEDLRDKPPRPPQPPQPLQQPQPPPLQPPQPPPLMQPPVPPPFLAGPGPRPRGPRPGFERRVAHPLGHLQSGRFTLPYDTNLYYIPEHDPRWITQSNDGNEHKLFIDDRAFELPLGCPPRHIMLGDTRVQISVDTNSRGIKIDSICYYKIGDMPRKVTINGHNYFISYRGPEKKVWIDEMAFEVHIDGPPESIFINGKEHSINIDSISNHVIIDNTIVCPFGGPPQQIDIGYDKHEIQFHPPQRKILIDGKLYEMNFTGKYPCVNTDGVDYGIRFDGAARVMLINGLPWTIEMDVPRKARIASSRAHVIGFGGPGHEVIINGQWYEIKFGGIEKTIRLGNALVKIRLEGPPPEVKILGQVVKDPVKIQELVGDAYIDPTVAVMTKREFEEPGNERMQQQFDQGPRMRMTGPDMGPRHMGPRGMGPQHMQEMGRGMPQRLRGGPRGGFHEGPQGPPPRGMPQHMEERGRGSPQYDEPGGRNSPNHPDNFGNMHNMDMDRPPQPLPHRQDGPRPLYAPHGPPQQPFGRPQGRNFRQGRNRGRGPRGMGRRDDFYQYGPPQGGGMRGSMGPQRMQHPPHTQQQQQHPPQDNFNNNFFPPHVQQQQQQPPQDQGYGPMQGMPQLPPAFTSQIDINDLFGKLVDSGIIKKTDDGPAVLPTTTSSTDTTPNTTQDVKTEQTPTTMEAAKTENGEPKVAVKPEPPKPKPKEKLPEVPDMTDFNLDKMKKRHQTVIQRMYGGIQCSSCGVRFVTEDMDKYREHLDWHFRQNRRDKDGVKVAKFRQWYYTTNEWIQFEEVGDLEERAHSMYFERLLQTQALPGSTGAMQMPAAPISCPAATGNASEDVCEMCGEQFENFFDEDTEEWCLRDAIRVGDKTYHPACYEDVNESSMMESSMLETPTPEAAEEGADPVSNPLAFLSMLTGSNPATTTDTASTATATATATAASDVKPEVKVETTSAPTVTVKTEATPDTQPPTTVAQDAKPVVIAQVLKTEPAPADNETTNKITTVGTGS